jgi:hypothetical protein
MPAQGRVETKSAWQILGVELKPAQYRIVLRAETPAVRVVRLLDEHCELKTARLQFWPMLDWSNWSIADEATLLRYARSFSFVTE